MTPEKNMLVLLKLDRISDDGENIHIMIEALKYSDGDSLEEINRHHDYYYGEHTCPSNLTGIAVRIAEGEEEDPHGLFTHVQTIFTPDCDWHNMKLSELFSKFEPFDLDTSKGAAPLNVRFEFETWFSSWADPNVGGVETSIKKNAAWMAWQAHAAIIPPAP